MLDPLAQRSVATDALACAAFVVNFVFAHRLGDYFGAQLGEVRPSPLLHFWSLAVEEQFYLVWPLTLLVATRRPRQYRRLLLTVILAGAAVSLLVSIWLTAVRPTWAFYLLPARMGELLAGAALAAAGPAFRAVDARLRAGLGWFGLFAVAVAVLRYDASTPFPGSAVLLPVLGTVLVLIAGGAGALAVGPVAALRHPVAQWIGHRSYAIYLWHWPALVLFAARYGPLSLAQRLAVVALSVGLAAATSAYIEDPVRHLRWLAVRPARGLALGGALCSLALGVGGLARATGPVLDSGAVAAAPVLAVAAPDPATGTTTVVPTTATPGAAPTTAAASATPVTLDALAGSDLSALVAANQRVLAQGIAIDEVPSNLNPSLGQAGADRAEIYADGCVNIGVDANVHATGDSCRYGSPDAPVRVVLFGDSHAAQWFPALQEIVEDRGDQLTVLTKGGCPTAAVSIPTATLARTCPQWRDARHRPARRRTSRCRDRQRVLGLSQHRRRVGAGLRRHPVAPGAAHRTPDRPRRQPAGAGRPGRMPVGPPAQRRGVRGRSRRRRRGEPHRRRAARRRSLRGDVRRHHRLAVHRQQVPGDDRQPAAVPRHDPPDHVRHAVVRAAARREHAVVTTWS